MYRQPLDISATAARIDRLRKHPDSHKYCHGHAFVLAGDSGRTGAGRLAARGALRIGAGLVTLGCPPESLPEAAAQVTAVMLRRVGDAAALTIILQDARLNALCLGPGLGVGEDTRATVDVALRAKRATVLDADALTSFGDDPRALFERLHSKCVLTPHEGEFARLFPDLAADLRQAGNTVPSRVHATRRAAARAGCCVLLKGARTVIADQEGRAARHSADERRAAPWLATAGSGDVLAGFITGLLARGFEPLEAAATAVWLHVECARGVGPGLIAEDLPEELPSVLRALGV